MLWRELLQLEKESTPFKVGSRGEGSGRMLFPFLILKYSYFTKYP